MLHTALGYPHCGEGAWGPLQFLTSRQHSLIGEQPSAQSGHCSPTWVAPGGSFFCFGRPLPDRPCHSPPSVLSFPGIGLCFPMRMPRPSSVSARLSWTGLDKAHLG